MRINTEEAFRKEDQTKNHQINVGYFGSRQVTNNYHFKNQSSSPCSY